MIFHISIEIIVLIACIVSLLWVGASYVKAKQALQWWQARQSMRLFTEAEKIRDGLLQESFAMHRSLERSLADHVSLSTNSSQDWLNNIQEFYHSLKQLSDYLSPAYIEDSLPLAIQSVVEAWQTDNSRIKIEIDLPANWKHEPPDRSLIILRILDELLQITLAELLTNRLIQISLKAQGDVGELIVHISYPDRHSLLSRNNLKELEYLRQTFRFLTSGQCCRRTQGLTVVWCFRWVMQVDRLQR